MMDIDVFGLDVESLADVFGIGIVNTRGEYRLWTTAPGLGQPLQEFAAWFKLAKAEGLFCTINGWFYDCPMVARVLEGEYDPGALKQFSDELIASDDWRRRRTHIDDELHVDLLALHGGMTQVSGSKELAIKFDLQSVRESPVDFNALSTTDEERIELFHTYNKMDLDTIIAAYQASIREIEARIALLLEYGSDVISSADAGVADRIMATQLYNGAKPPYPQTDIWKLPLAPLCQKVKFNHNNLVELLDRLRPQTLEFKLVEVVERGQPRKKIESARFTESVSVGGKDCRLGKGGLHTEDSPSFYIAGPEHRLLEADFKSFYPALILFHRICPQHLPRHPFLSSFQKLVDKRLAVRDTDAVLSNGLKIAVNSIFGKSGSASSWLCDPSALSSVTILGQLTLLALIDLILAEGGDALQLVSANTDSVMIRINADIADSIIEKANAFAKTQGQSLGWTEFSRVVKRDINNYLAFGLDGRLLRAKGAYQYDVGRVRGKATNRIAVDAAQDFLGNDTPVEQTVRACTDVRKYIDYRKVQRTHVIADDQGHSYGRIQRWVICTGPDGLHLDAMRKADGQRTQIVERGARLLPDLPDAVPTDIDYNHYIGLAEDLIAAITNPPIHDKHVIPLAELSVAQREQHRVNATTLTPDLARCEALDLTKLASDYNAIHRGNLHDSMKSCLLRLWWSQCGALTQGDLLHCALHLDASMGYFAGNTRNLERMVEWIAYDVSPFPIPRTTAEFAERALAWAGDNVQPLKRKRVKLHKNATSSDFINGEALRHYGKTRNEYKLACHIASVSIKHDAKLTSADVANIIQDVKTFYEQALHETVR